MLPALAAGGAAAIRGLPTLASRLGIPGKVGSIMNFAKANPSTFLLAAKETYDQGVSIYDQLVAADPQGMAQLQRMASSQLDAMSKLIPADPIGADALRQLDLLEDEMDTIDDAIRVVGGFDQLQALRRALTFSDDHFAMYLRLRRISNRIG